MRNVWVIYHQSLCGPFRVLISTSEACVCKRNWKGHCKCKTGRHSRLHVFTLLFQLCQIGVLSGFSFLAIFKVTLYRSSHCVAAVYHTHHWIWLHRSLYTVWAVARDWGRTPFIMHELWLNNMNNLPTKNTFTRQFKILYNSEQAKVEG